jgi:CDP-diacylglycerol--serine O-phosphatidyltransferase
MIPLLFVGGALLLLLAIYPMEVLIVISLAYLGSIPFSMRRYKALTQADVEKVQTESAPPTA